MAQLLGPDGLPIEKRVLTTEAATPTIGGVRSILAGHPSAGLDPARLASILRQAIEGDATAYLELSEDMEEKDLHYLGVLGTRKRQVAQLEITVEPAGEDAASAEHAAMVEAWIRRECLEDELIDLLDAVAKGFSVLEIAWETSSGEWRPGELIRRDPRWFCFDRVDGRTLLLRTEAAPLGEPLPAYKFVQHIHSAKSGLPIRGGLARAVCWCWLFKNFDLKAWVGFAELFGQPIRVGKYGPNATREDKQVLLRAVTEIARDAAAIIPDSMMVEFVEAKLSGNLDLFRGLADWLDQQVSKAILGQTTTTDAISGGHAVSQEHDKVREDIERSDARQVAATLNRDVVRPLIALNFGPQAAYPRIRIGRPEEIDAAAVVDAVSKLVPLGFKVGQEPVRGILGLPKPEAEDELLGTPGPITPPTSNEPGKDVVPPAGGTTSVQTAAAQPADVPPDPIERLLADLAASGALGDAMQPLTGAIGELAARAGDVETFKRLLAEHLAQADVSRMAELISRACFFGDVAGRVGAAIEEQV